MPITARAVTASLQVISTSSWCIVLRPLVLYHQDYGSWPPLRSPSVPFAIMGAYLKGSGTHASAGRRRVFP
jgi:hypothetical protein